MILQQGAPNSTIFVLTPASCHQLHGCRLNAALFTREMSPGAWQNRLQAFQSHSGGEEMSHLRLLPHAGKQADSSAAHNCIKSTKIGIYTRHHQSWLHTSVCAEVTPPPGERHSIHQPKHCRLCC